MGLFDISQMLPEIVKIFTIEPTEKKTPGRKAAHMLRKCEKIVLDLTPQRSSAEKQMYASFASWVYKNTPLQRLLMSLDVL